MLQHGDIIIPFKCVHPANFFCHVTLAKKIPHASVHDGRFEQVVLKTPIVIIAKDVNHASHPLDLHLNILRPFHVLACGIKASTSACSDDVHGAVLSSCLGCRRSFAHLVIFAFALSCS